MKRKIHKKTVKEIMTIVVAIVIVTCCSIKITLATSIPDDKPDVLPSSYVSVQVEDGDTLSELSEQYVPEGMTLNAYMKEVAKLNNISIHCITSGNYLLFPLYNE